MFSDTTTTQQQSISRFRFVGVWMAALIALFMILNFARALLQPVGFSAYVGLPVADASQAGFVQLYAFRALFLGVFTGFLIWRGSAEPLKWFALIAVVMPLGDALLTFQSGAAPMIIARHLGIAIFLVVTALMLRRWEHHQNIR